MTDWKSMARAMGLRLSDEELTRTVAPLELMEPLFSRLAERVETETDPAVIFDSEDTES